MSMIPTASREEVRAMLDSSLVSEDLADELFDAWKAVRNGGLDTTDSDDSVSEIDESQIYNKDSSYGVSTPESPDTDESGIYHDQFR